MRLESLQGSEQKKVLLTLLRCLRRCRGFLWNGVNVLLLLLYIVCEGRVPLPVLLVKRPFFPLYLKPHGFSHLPMLSQNRHVLLPGNSPTCQERLQFQWGEPVLITLPISSIENRQGLNLISLARWGHFQISLLIKSGQKLWAREVDSYFL